MTTLSRLKFTSEIPMVRILPSIFTIYLIVLQVLHTIRLRKSGQKLDKRVGSRGLTFHVSEYKREEDGDRERVLRAVFQFQSMRKCEHG